MRQVRQTFSPRQHVMVRYHNEWVSAVVLCESTRIGINRREYPFVKVTTDTDTFEVSNSRMYILSMDEYVRTRYGS